MKKVFVIVALFLFIKAMAQTIEENIAKGKIVLLKGNEMTDEIPFTTIGRKRILTFPTTSFDSLKFLVEDANGTAMISGISVYRIDDVLLEKN